MSSDKLKIEVLYFLDCPSWKQTINDLNSVLGELDVKAEIILTLVETNEKAEAFKFPGSPTIRMNGMDLFPVTQHGFALQCRMYQTQSGLRGTPTREMLKEQFLRILE